MQLLILATTFVHFSEIMYAPTDGNEYVEIYGNENLSDCIFGDLARNVTLNTITWSENPYQLILPAQSPYSVIPNTTIYSVSKLGNGLNNDGDTIWLSCNDTILDNVTFYGTIANRNNRSLELHETGWFESILGGTPGREMEQESTETNISEEKNETKFTLNIILPDTIYAHYEYTSVFRITNHAKPGNATWKYVLLKNNSIVLNGSGNRFVNKFITADTAKILVREQGNYTLCAAISNQEYCTNISIIDTTKDPCNISLVLSSPLIIREGEQLQYSIELTNKSIPFRATYSILDEYGEVIREPFTTEKPGTKRYTPHGQRTRLIHINSSLDFIACNTSGNRNAETYAIYVPNDSEPSVIIERVNLGKDKTVKAGENAIVRIFAYRGKHKENTVKIWAEQEGKVISAPTNIGLDVRDVATFTVSLPILRGEGMATVHAEGFGKQDTEKIMVEKNKEEEIQLKYKEEKEKIKSPTITSLYTRAEYYQLPINIFAKTKNADNILIYEAKLIGEKKAEDTLQIPVNITSPNSTILLIAQGNGTSVKTLNLQMKVRAEKAKNNNVPKFMSNITIDSKARDYRNGSRSTIKYLPFVVVGLALLILVFKPNI